MAQISTWIRLSNDKMTLNEEKKESQWEVCIIKYWINVETKSSNFSYERSMNNLSGFAVLKGDDFLEKEIT